MFFHALVPLGSAGRAVRQAVCALAISVGLGAGVGAQTQPAEVPGEIAVKLRSTGALAGLLGRHGLTLQSQFGARPIYRLKVISPASVADKLAALALDPDVLLAEANAIHSAPEARRSIAWAIGTPEAYGSQWALPAIRLTEAHRFSTGAGVRVAVLDSGVDFTHPLLAGRLLPGWDFVDNDANPSEPPVVPSLVYGHGTHVAGLIATVAPQASILPLRVLDPQGNGDQWVLGEAILHAIDPDRNPATNDGAQVINLSLGTGRRMRMVDVAIQLATCATPDPADPVMDLSDPGYNLDKERCRLLGGSVVSVAAGNDASRALRQYPAASGVYGLISVGASTRTGQQAEFSNFGSWVDVAAPGEGVLSSVPGNQYASWSGTSMAAPMVAGVAALLRAVRPDLAPTEVVRRIRRFSVELCDAKLRQIDALGAVTGRTPPELRCR